ncbi:MAG TPA: helix-turn-helix transcriptional regulator, partial [Candidatus Caccenecus avistercoris]|nr:helix-turn-helix transcriptional regulator [Candidatus Caccenecus avistercoris]
LAEYLKCNKSTVFRYFNGKIPFKIDILIRLSKLYRIDLDSLCGKK